MPAKLAASLFVLPFRRLGRNLSLAMRDPKDLPALDEISFLTGLAISPFVSLDVRIQVALSKHYGVTVDPRYPDLAARIDAGGGMVAVAPPKTPKPFLRTSSAVLRPLSPEAAAPAPGPVPEVPKVEAAAPPAPRDAAEVVAAPHAAAPPARPRDRDRAGRARGAESPVRRRRRRPAAAEPTSAVGGEETSPLVEEEAPADLVASLSKAESRDDIAAAVLGEAGRLLHRAALFIAQADRVIGWAAVPEPPEGLRSFSVAFSEPSLFASLQKHRRLLRRPLPGPPGKPPGPRGARRDLPGRRRGGPRDAEGKERPVPRSARPVPGEAPPKAMELKRLGALTAIALEILLLKNRLRSL